MSSINKSSKEFTFFINRLFTSINLSQPQLSCLIQSFSARSWRWRWSCDSRSYTKQDLHSWICVHHPSSSWQQLTDARSPGTKTKFVNANPQHQLSQASPSAARMVGKKGRVAALKDEGDSYMNFILQVIGNGKKPFYDRRPQSRMRINTKAHAGADLFYFTQLYVCFQSQKQL